MGERVKLRPWQHAALKQFADHAGPDFLLECVPAGGKTFAACAALRILLGQRPARVVVVVPTAHLKRQWAQEAAALGIHLDPAWSPAQGSLPADMHGVVTTYQQVAAGPAPFRGLAHGAYVVLDEIHHAGDEQAWGAALLQAFSPAERRLGLSGTPFRSDTRAIPFVHYHDDEAVPDYQYTYADALRDGRVVRPVYFPRLGGEMEWTGNDGATYAASFDDPLTRELSNQRLRTALSLEGEWLPAVLREAVARLEDVRRTHPDAAGLVIAMDQDHARGIAELLSVRFRQRVALVTSDDPEASDRLADFARGGVPWCVAVRMVSEGVNVPRLRVLVYATTVRSELFWRQAVGRVTRWLPGLHNQRAWVYIPDDPVLRALAIAFAEQRRHSLRRDTDPDRMAPGEDAPARTEPGLDSGQLSLFAPLSAVATGTPEAWMPWAEPLPEALDDTAVAVELELAPPPPVRASDADVTAGQTRRDAKDALRAANADAARTLARRTGQSHAQVNAELNRRVGLRRIGEATLAQLQARLHAAERWLAVT